MKHGIVSILGGGGMAAWTAAFMMAAVLAGQAQPARADGEVDKVDKIAVDPTAPDGKPDRTLLDDSKKAKHKKKRHAHSGTGKNQQLPRKVKNPHPRTE